MTKTQTVGKNALFIRVLLYILLALMLLDGVFFQTYREEVVSVYAGAVCALGVAALAVYGKSALPRLNNRTGLFALLWCAFAVVSVFWAYSPSHAYAEAVKYCAFTAVFIIGCAAAANGLIDVLLKGCVLIMCVMALLSVEGASTRLLTSFMRANLTGGRSYIFWDGRLMAMPNANVAAALFFVGAIICFYLLQAREKSGVWLMSGGILLASVMMLCVSVGAFLTCAAVCALMIVLFKGSRFKCFFYLLYVFLFAALAALPMAYCMERDIAPYPLIICALCVPAGALALFLWRKTCALSLKFRWTAALAFAGAICLFLFYGGGGVTIDGEFRGSRALEAYPGEYTLKEEISNAGRDSGLWIDAEYFYYDETGKEHSLGNSGQTLIYATDGTHEQTFAAPPGAEGMRLTFAAKGEFRLAPIEVNYITEGKKRSLSFADSLLSLLVSRAGSLTDNQSARERFAYYGDALKISAASPLWGKGAGAFEPLSLRVQNRPYESRYAHSHYLQTLAETGIIGLALFAAMTVCALAALIKGLKGEQSALAAALICVFAVLLIHSAVDFDMSFELALSVFALFLGVSNAVFGVKTEAKRKKLSFAALLALPAVGLCLTIGHGAAVSAVRSLNGEPAVSLDKLRTAVPAAAFLDPLHRYDYFLDFVNVTMDVPLSGKAARQREEYARELRAQAEKSLSVTQTLLSYYALRGNEEETVKLAAAMPFIRPLEPELYRQAFCILDELAANGSGETVKENARAARSRLIDLYAENERAMNAGG